MIEKEPTGHDALAKGRGSMRVWGGDPVKALASRTPQAAPSAFAGAAGLARERAGRARSGVQTGARPALRAEREGGAEAGEHGAADEGAREPRFGHEIGKLQIHPAGGDGMLIQRQVAPGGNPPVAAPVTPPPACGAEPVRASPTGGVAIQGGQLAWTLTCLGQRDPPVRYDASGTPILTTGLHDLRISATFTPSAPGSCRTFTFLQTVRGQVGGVQDHPHLLFTRDAASGASVDVHASEREPFYGAGPVAAGGLGNESDSSQALPGAGPGAIEFLDTPRVLTRGLSAVREFEVAVICAESGQTMGSLRYGYTKNAAGTVELTGGRVADVSTAGATAGLEPVRQAFYAGYFQHSLGGFARGSATLTRAHRATLQGIARTAEVERIVLVGANDNSGGPEANAALSVRRAEAARDMLVNELHVPAANVVVEGHGVEARVPNPAGVSVAANRRVDIHLERGSATVPAGQIGDPIESLRARHQNPQTTFVELTRLLLELRTHRTVREDEWAQVHHLMDGLRRWRRLDPSVPDPEEAFRDVLRDVGSRRERPPPQREALPPLTDRLLSDPTFPPVRDRIEAPLRRPPF